MQPSLEPKTNWLLSEKVALPRWAIIALALLIDLVLVGSLVNRYFTLEGDPGATLLGQAWLFQLKAALVNDNPMVNVGVVMGFLYPNSEVYFMFLTRMAYRAEMAKARDETAAVKARADADIAKVRDKADADIARFQAETAVAQARAEAANAEKAAAEARAKAWFDAYQADPDNAPPPPWSSNGNGAEEL